LARLLLSDVREAVSQIRGNETIDMAATLEPLVGNVPGLKVEMRLPRPFPMEDPERAHVLLRCTQEIITNAVRHAQANVLQLQYRLDRGAVHLVARDDGRGADGFTRSEERRVGKELRCRWSAWHAKRLTNG